MDNWRKCPRCNLLVNASARADHDARCRRIEAEFGSVARMVEAFRADETLTPAALSLRVARVGSSFIIDLLVAGGVTPAEITERVHVIHWPSPASHGCCRRCEVLLGPRGARPSDDDDTLCVWCVAETARRPRARCCA